MPYYFRHDFNIIWVKTNPYFFKLSQQQNVIKCYWADNCINNFPTLMQLSLREQFIEIHASME